MREMRRTESTERPGASTAYETFRFGAYRSQSSGEAGTGDRRNVIDSSEKGSKIDGGRSTIDETEIGGRTARGKDGHAWF